MTTQLTIPTPFADLAELTENFAQRVDEQRLMLPNAEPITEGEWVQFEVQLADGTAALAGVGRVQGAFDNGEEHPAEYRFDVVLDSLQLEGMHEVMFERLLVARETQLRGEPVTGEVSVEELERRQAAEAAAGAASEADVGEADVGEADVGEADVGEADVGDGAGNWEDAADEATHAGEPLEASPNDVEPTTGEVDVGDMVEQVVPRAASVRPAPPAAAKAPKAAYPVSAPREPGKLPSPHTFNGRALTRPTHPAAWAPQPSVRPDAAQSSGLFDYQGGVPRPARPPRPELDASQRVQPAPRPGAPWPRRGTGTHAVVADEPVAAAEGEAFEDLGESEQPMVAGEGETAQLEAPGGERDEW